MFPPLPDRMPASPDALAGVRRLVAVAGVLVRRLAHVRIRVPTHTRRFDLAVRPLAFRPPRLEGRPGAWFVRGADGVALPVDPDDLAGLRDVARRCLDTAPHPASDTASGTTSDSARPAPIPAPSGAPADAPSDASEAL